MPRPNDAAVATNEASVVDPGFLLGIEIDDAPIPERLDRSPAMIPITLQMLHDTQVQLVKVMGSMGVEERGMVEEVLMGLLEEVWGE